MKGRVPVFVLPSGAGGQTGPGAVRSKYNLVLVFLGSGRVSEAEQYLLDLAAVNPGILAEQGRVMAVVGLDIEAARETASRLVLPYPLLADEDASVAARMLGEPGACALCVADRYGEVYCMETALTPSDLPSTRSALEWLQYIQSECPE